MTGLDRCARPTLLLVFAAHLAACPVACGGRVDADRERRSGDGSGGVEPATGGVGAGGEQNAPPSGGGTSTGGTASLPDPVGVFLVHVQPANAEMGLEAYAQLMGSVRDRALAPGLAFAVLQEQGRCQLLQPAVPLCDPPCAQDQTCVRSNQQDHCVPASSPVAHSVGLVTVQGVTTAAGETSFSIEPASPFFYYRTELAYPPFAEGDTVELAAEGGDYVPFNMRVRAIRPLEVLAYPTLVVPGEPYNLSWSAASVTGNSTIEVELNLSQGGRHRGRITCQGDDTGSLEIPAGLVTQLIELGVTGYPSVTITRKAVDSEQIPPGRVDLMLLSTLDLQVEVPGFTSCAGLDGCPDGQTCNIDDYLCVP